MAAVQAALDLARVQNPATRALVTEWAAITTPAHVVVVGAGDDARLIREALDAGELLPAGEGRYYARSHSKDTARSEERTVVDTGRESDRGVYNNWRPAEEVTVTLRERMCGASVGETMHVLPCMIPCRLAQ